MTETHQIVIEYEFCGETDENGDAKQIHINVNVHKETSEEEAAQILVRAYQTVASRVLQKHIVMGCDGCDACGMNTEALKGIDRAYKLH